MTALIGIDTSVAVPLLVEKHAAHPVVDAWARGRRLALCGHAALEAYSVLTRLPGDLRLDPADAVRLCAARLAPSVVVSEALQARLPERLVEADVAGGAAYDGMIALAACEAGVPLATRDARALGTYQAVGAEVLVVAG